MNPVVVIYGLFFKGGKVRQTPGHHEVWYIRRCSSDSIVVLQKWFDRSVTEMVVEASGKR